MCVRAEKRKTLNLNCSICEDKSCFALFQCFCTTLWS